MKNAINWFEIPTADFDRARGFYETILGEKMDVWEVMNTKYASFPGEMPGVGGALSASPNNKPSADGARVYLNANPDLSPVLARVESAGGKVLMPKTQISADIGFMAILEDSEGNQVALHSSN